jgi:hypothetical protein
MLGIAADFDGVLEDHALTASHAEHLGDTVGAHDDEGAGFDGEGTTGGGTIESAFTSDVFALGIGGGGAEAEGDFA